MKILEKHTPVLLEEVVSYLNIQPGASIVDATLNGGGHTFGLLEKFPDIKILGIEWDPEIFQAARSKIQESEFKNNIAVVNDSYVHIKEICKRLDIRPDGVLFDLGVSSHHYQNGRGFTFRTDESLDMRFNPKAQSLTAADIVNGYAPEEIDRIVGQYGEEKFSKEISKSITHFRQIKPIERTLELVQAIEKAVPSWYRHRKIHFATKTFQALRMEVNNELESIKKGLQAAIEVLKPGGRLLVISFHGLEDKTVRGEFKSAITDGLIRWVTKDTIRPNWSEIKNNPRARSAKMKIAEKI